MPHSSAWLESFAIVVFAGSVVVVVSVVDVVGAGVDEVTIGVADSDADVVAAGVATASSTAGVSSLLLTSGSLIQKERKNILVARCEIF